MNARQQQRWRQGLAVGLLAAIDLAVSLPIMGATCRPFSWMTIGQADSWTLYPIIQQAEKPVIQRIEKLDGGITVSVSGAPRAAVAAGQRLILQRSTNLLDAGAWTDAAALSAASQVTTLTDTNRFERVLFYRVILREDPPPQP